MPIASAVNVTGGGAIVTTPTALWGFWLVTSAAATVTIYDNASAASGTILAQWSTAAAGADKSMANGNAIRCANGIFIQVSAGALTGSVQIE